MVVVEGGVEDETGGIEGLLGTFVEGDVEDETGGIGTFVEGDVEEETGGIEGLLGMFVEGDVEEEAGGCVELAIGFVVNDSLRNIAMVMYTMTKMKIIRRRSKIRIRGPCTLGISFIFLLE